MKEHKKPYTIGITGTIASGKSSVGRILKDEGIPVIDSDKVVHKLLAEDPAVRESIRDRFGNDVFSDGVIDRIKLGNIVFNNPNAKKTLETIVHPGTILECRRQVKSFHDAKIVAILVPLLFEANLENEYDEIWCVYTKLDEIKKRLKERDSLSESDIERRLGAQLDQEEKVRRSDQVIENSGSLEETREQVIAILKHLP